MPLLSSPLVQEILLAHILLTRCRPHTMVGFGRPREVIPLLRVLIVLIRTLRSWIHWGIVFSLLALILPLNIMDIDLPKLFFSILEGIWSPVPVMISPVVPLSAGPLGISNALSAAWAGFGWEKSCGGGFA